MDKEWLGFDDVEEGTAFEDYEQLLEQEDDTVDSEMALEFVDDVQSDMPFGECLVRARDVLGRYSFDEIMDMNEYSDEELLATLFERGDVGLPAEITDEEVSDLPDEETEES